MTAHVMVTLIMVVVFRRDVVRRQVVVSQDDCSPKNEDSLNECTSSRTQVPGTVPGRKPTRTVHGVRVRGNAHHEALHCASSVLWGYRQQFSTDLQSKLVASAASVGGYRPGSQWPTLRCKWWYRLTRAATYDVDWRTTEDEATRDTYSPLREHCIWRLDFEGCSRQPRSS